MLERIPTKKIGIGVAALVLVLIVGSLVFGPGARLDRAGEKLDSHATFAKVQP
jgi:hypothetical protein